MPLMTSIPQPCFSAPVVHVILWCIPNFAIEHMASKLWGPKLGDTPGLENSKRGRGGVRACKWASMNESFNLGMVPAYGVYLSGYFDVWQRSQTTPGGSIWPAWISIIHSFTAKLISHEINNLWGFHHLSHFSQFLHAHFFHVRRPLC